MKITSIKSFIDALNSITRDKDHELFFRGHSKVNNDLLIPTIYRKENIGFLQNEDKIFREIISYLPDEFRTEKTTFDCLVKMQHYSIPTRLLDITRNPLVALYFAAKFHPGNHGELIVFKIPNDEIRHFESDSVSIVSNLAKRPISFDITKAIKKGTLEKFNDDTEIHYLLHEIRSEKPYFHPIIQPGTINSVQCVNPKMNNLRILRQEGAFLLFGIENKKEARGTIDQKWLLLKNDSEKFFIYQKKKIIEELNLIGINERFLFPELENQSKFLKEKYNI